MRQRLEKGLPRERGTKREVRPPRPPSPGAEPGYRVEEGPTQSSRGARAGVGPSGSGARLPASLRSRARGPEDRLGAGGRRRRADSSCCGCLVPSTAEELSFLPSLLPSPPPTSCRRALRRREGGGAWPAVPSLPTPFRGSLVGVESGSGGRVGHFGVLGNFFPFFRLGERECPIPRDMGVRRTGAEELLELRSRHREVAAPTAGSVTAWYRSTSGISPNTPKIRGW